MTAPLSGLRVVDSTNNRGELCGRLLADLGADVILVEPPEGSDLRRCHPFSPDGTQSLAFAWRNSNKRGVAIDTTRTSGQQQLDELLAEADVWIESSPPNSEVDPATVAAAHPQLVVTSITPFGHTGPYRDYLADNDVLEAFSATMFKAGVAAKAPLLPPTAMATDIAAVVAAMATALAVYQRGCTGHGQHIDLSIMTAAAAATDWSYATASVSRASGHPHNEVRSGGGFMYPTFRCVDGYVRTVILSKRQWMSMWDWMGCPAAFADEEFWSSTGNRIMNADVLNPAYEEFFADKSMLDICAEGQNRGIVVTPLLTPAEVLTEPHFSARGTFVETEVAPGLRTRVASGFMEFNGERQGITTRAPTLNEHAGARFLSPSIGYPAASGEKRSAPLAGIRVLDFGIGGVGVEASRVLAEYGADVIKIETRTYPDFLRLVSLSETSAPFASSSRSKRSLGVNVKTNDGLALVRELVASTDVLVENSATGTLESLGLGYGDLARINPALVMVSSQLVGSRGPNAHWTGYGPTTQNYGGLLHLWDYDDEDPPAANQTIYPDHLAGRLCALAAVAALIARRQHGGGVHAEVALVETVINMLGEKLLEEALTPDSAQPAGNRSPEHAPRGPYPCSGDQHWVVISVRSDQQWLKLCGAMDNPEWAGRAVYENVEGRIANADEIDSRLGEWTSTISRSGVVEVLQNAGVPCGAMLCGADMLDDPHLKARGWTLEVEQPGVGPMGMEGPAWLAADMVGPTTGPAPGLGQHTRQIAADLLGLDNNRIDELVSRGVLETDPPTVT